MSNAIRISGQNLCQKGKVVCFVCGHFRIGVRAWFELPGAVCPSSCCCGISKALQSQQNCACTAQSKERAQWSFFPYPTELYWSVWALTSGYLSEQLHIQKLFAYTACGALIQNRFSVFSIVILCFSRGNTRTKIVEKCKSETTGKKKPSSSQGLWQ